jgi:glyoxylase-like metal-dependent hydrolase (beta-lactamase superfamily II)
VRPATWLVFFSVLAGACAPRFAHVATPAAGSAGSAGPIAVSVVTGRWSNIYLLRRGGDALLVDSGSAPDCDALDAALAAAGAPHVRAVIVTHAHADHAGCARELQRRGAAIVLGAGDVATAARGRNAGLAPTGLLAALISPLFLFPFEPFAPDLAVDREVDLGAYGFGDVRVAPAPGHTPGELVVVTGDAAFVGDMLKGGQVFAHSPTEHLYQDDRVADHAAIAAVLARPGVVTLYPGHGGSLAAADVRSWLAGADMRGRDGALAIELGARLAFPGDVASAGVRMRLALGGAVGYAAGLDAGVAGAFDASQSGTVPVDAYPLGVALRGRGGALVTLLGGAGIGGLRGISATHAIAELAAELPVAGARILARGSLAWGLTGPAENHVTLAGQKSALLGMRLGADAPLGAYVAGHGPFVAATFDDIDGVRFYGLALGLQLFAAR